MKKQFRINLNDTVRVKLTRLGEAIYRHRYDQINACTGEETIKPMNPKKDEEGYTSFQLWSFIELYGQHIGMGRPNVIEPLDIVWSVDVWKKDEVDVRYTDEDHAWIDGKQWISLRRFQEAVGAARQRGKWKRAYLDHEAMGERPSVFYCSACCQCVAYPVNYCPYCGADMRGEQDG